jgi:methionyl-tRNA formyltransferase
MGHAGNTNTLTMKDTTIAFFGTPHLAVFALEEMESAGILPSVVVCAPDRPAGRKLQLTPPPVKIWAEERDIPVLQPESLKNPEDAPELYNSEWDVFVVTAYNIIIPEKLLYLPAHHTLNIHPSLLPKLRGPSPIRSAILEDAQDAVGVSIIELDKKVDHGPIVAQARIELPQWPVPGNTLDELLFREGGRLMADVLPLWMQGDITPEAQDDTQATHTKKFEKANGEIDINGDATHNYHTYCAMEGWPGTFFFDKDGKRVKINSAHMDDGQFIIDTVVPEGKKEMEWNTYKNHFLH